MKTRTVLTLLLTCVLAATTQADMVVHHWALEETEGTTAYDSVGTLHATNIGADIGLPGPGDPDFKAYQFGSEEGDVVDTGAAFIPTTGDWAAYVTFMTQYEHPSGDQGHLLSFNDGADDYRGALYVYKNNVGWWQKNGAAVAGPAVTDGAWHTAGIVREGITWTLYLDGNPVGSADADVPVPAINVAIGNGVGYDYDFEGFISDVVFIPEPATLILLGLGSLALIRRKR
jgi:hypothetical protein